MIFSSYTPFTRSSTAFGRHCLASAQYSNAYIDLCLAIAAMALTLSLVLTSVKRGAVRRLLLLTAMIAIPAGGVFFTVDRPEVLAYGMTLALLVAWLRNRRYSRSPRSRSAAQRWSSWRIPFEPA